MSWDSAFAWSILPQLLSGLETTLLATLLATALSLVIGLVFALGRRSKIVEIRVVVGSFVEFIRRTPILVQIYFIYFVLPEIGIVLPGFATGVIALGLHTGAYMSEVYRAGIESVPRGQWEAAKALNYTPRETWLKVILPQAIPPMVPALGNYTILMFKDSSLLSIIAVPELATVARNATLQTDMPLQVFAITAAVYFIALFCISAASRACERRVSRMLPHGH